MKSKFSKTIKSGGSVLLDKQIQQGSLSHAYLFMGPSGSGKQRTAREFAAKILQTEELNNHPDFISFSVSNDTGVEAIRNFIGQLSVKPFFGSYKVALLGNAHLLNNFGANSLLKTLEEPTPSTVLILTSPVSDVLPTIASRCMKINFSAETENLPGTASDLSPYLEALDDLIEQPLSEKILAVTKFSELEDAQLEGMLLAWALRQEQRLSTQPERYMLIRNIFTAVSNLRGSGNKKMILQQLLLNVAHAKS